MPATIDQNLAPNAIVEFNAAKDIGKSDGEAWIATVARLRYDVLQLAIATLALGVSQTDDESDVARKQCIHELLELQGEYEGEPDQPA